MAREVFIKVAVLGTNTGPGYNLWHTARSEASGGIKLNDTLIDTEEEINQLLSGSYWTINDESARDFFLTSSTNELCDTYALTVLEVPPPAEKIPVAPVIENPSILKTSTTSFTTYTSISEVYDYNVVEKGFYIGISATMLSNTKYIITGTELSFSKSLSSLIEGSTYYVWAFVKNSANQITYSERVEIILTIARPGPPSLYDPWASFTVTSVGINSITGSVTHNEAHGADYITARIRAYDFRAPPYNKSYSGTSVNLERDETGTVQVGGMLPGVYTVYASLSNNLGSSSSDRVRDVTVTG